MEDRHIIWSNENLDLDDWREDLQEQYPDCSEDELYRIMCETNADYLSDERVNLNIQLSQPILVIADLGLWNGRRMGYKEIPSGNIRDCLSGGYDYKDIKRWSFNLEVYFLQQRFKDVLEIASSDDVIIQDRTIFEGVYIFVANNKAMGNLSDRDYETYMDLFKLMMSLVKAPDLLIYLRSSVPHLVSFNSARSVPSFSVFLAITDNHFICFMPFCCRCFTLRGSDE